MKSMNLYDLIIITNIYQKFLYNDLNWAKNSAFEIIENSIAFINNNSYKNMFKSIWDNVVCQLECPHENHTKNYDIS